MSIDLTIGSIGDISLKYARQQKTDSIKNLSSGKKQDMAWKDSGSYSLGLRLENQKRYESGLSASLQNAMSIAQSQEDEENGETGGSAAYVTTSQYGNGTADVIKMSFDLPDFNAPHTQPQSTTDRVVAHEMVHLLHAQNTYYADPTGDGSSSAKWLKEGLAEFIHGADDRVFSILGANPSDGEITSLINAIGTGNESWSTSEQYASGYLAARYLDYEIKQAGQSGIKHMTQWMKTQFDANAGAAASGFNTYVATFLSGRGYNSDDNDGFLQAFKGSGGTVSGLDYIKDADKFNYTNNITNSDTGSVRGSDAGGSTSYGAQDVIPDANGAPQGSYVADESSEPISMTFSGDGDTSTLNPISPITFGDTSTYNLSTVDSATATLEYLESLMESVASLRSTIGGNMSVTQNNLDALNHRTTTLAQAVSKTGDTSISDETLSMAKNIHTSANEYLHESTG